MPHVEITKLQELIYELRVGQVMKTDVITVTPSTAMGELREILRANRISGTPVIEDGGMVGIISIEDFIGWLTDGRPDCRVADRMTRNVTGIHDDDALVQAVNSLERFGFGRLPVIARDSGKLVGVITKGDIVIGLLKHLDVDYLEAEKRGPRSKHIFEDIVADKSTLIFEYRVVGGDFSRAGTSASGLKTTLRRLGVHPQVARRAAIATYEAEMNLIVFTEGGRITAQVGPKMIQLVMKDDGPGIPDIEKAMEPGYSTAPEWVRELGFGAGMGLNNIKNCADRMRLTSTVGQGTRVEADILLEFQGEAERDH